VIDAAAWWSYCQERGLSTLDYEYDGLGVERNRETTVCPANHLSDPWIRSSTRLLVEQDASCTRIRAILNTPVSRNLYIPAQNTGWEYDGDARGYPHPNGPI
jgi:hypothetical protein